MLLSMASFGLLALLFLAWSRPATSNFVCNDKSIPGATEGFCLRAVQPKWDDKDKSIPTGSAFLMIPAHFVQYSKPFQANIYTCDGVSISNHPVETRFCCDFKKKPPQTPFPLYYNDLHKHCISRDKPPPPPGENPT